MFNDNQDPFSNMSSTPDNMGKGTSRREQLGIDENGNSEQKLKEERYSNQQQQKQSKFGRGSFGSGRGGGNGNGPKEHSLIFTLVVIALVVGIAIYLPSAYRAGSLTGPFRSLFASPQENMDSFMVGILQTDKTISDLDKTEVEIEETAIYDRNNIFQSQFLDSQVEPEYMVYIYTGDEEMDAPFDKWVADYESNTPKESESVESEEDSETEGSEETPTRSNHYKIYRLNLSQIEFDSEVFEYVDNKPMMLIYNTPTRGVKSLDSVVKEPTQLDEIPTYMDKMVEEANVNW